MEKRNENAQAIVKNVLNLINENIDNLSNLKVTDDVDEQKKLDDDYRNALNKVVEEVALMPYTIDDLKYGLNVMDTVVKMISKAVLGTIEGNEVEILSRIYGAKNEQGKFDKYSASISDIVLKLKEVRENTGNNLMDYYT